MQLRLQVAQIPQANCFIRGSSSQHGLGSWVERDTVDGITVLAISGSCCVGGVGLPNVQNLKCNVVGYCAD